MITIRKQDWEFLKILGKNKMTLSEIQKKLNSKGKVCESQKIYNKLINTGLIQSKKEGRNREVKLSSSGLYFHKHLMIFEKMKK